MQNALTKCLQNRTGLFNALVRKNSRGVQEIAPLINKSGVSLSSGGWFDVYDFSLFGIICFRLSTSIIAIKKLVMVSHNKNPYHLDCTKHLIICSNYDMK